MAYRLGVDVGGTFTDLLLFDDADGRFWRFKTPSTPHDQSEGVIVGVSAICALAQIALAQIGVFLHGTTVATSAVLEGKGARVGLPFFGNQVRLLDAAGVEVATGEIGELHSISSGLFSGYWGQPAATREAFRDGWVSVGDMARRDDEGYLYIVDRKKDMVITGGTNVYPREIERVLDEHAFVVESAVIGVPDAQWGERLVAYVVVSPRDRFDPASLSEFAQSRLAPFKRPKDFIAVAALPRNATGKVSKIELRGWHAAMTKPKLDAS